MVPGDGSSEPLEFAVAFGMILASAGGRLTACAALDPEGTQKTVSRASPVFSAGAAIMTETINAVSMTVTAKARTRVPNGSPTRCATTSAWYTAANTVPSKAIPAAAAISP